ncbi:trigger factor [Tomitella fengzijianii]|uniref:Trigger factor n=1 Tax=Tomitella fengzijianii TaxID=2597660 RepID=A0A516X4P9_9ACTN|nr:trigger factor [Tomitella fengzijianii]QDQ98059.1 trigger factor [Tomitella fengzijianii]
MKSTVEQLSPTRVRINVEVPFEELKPDFDAVYRQLAQQVRVPGFRPGKAPAKIIETRVGRGAVIEQVLQNAVPGRYTEAVTTNDIKAISQPEIEVTNIEDGDHVEFTAEVDVRPEIDLPDFSSIAVEVDPIAVTDEAVDEQLDALRARFGTLTGVDRAVQDGDFVSIDLAATVDGEPVPEATAEGLSHEVGSGQLIEGLDEAVVGVEAEGSAEFTTKLLAGEHAGQEAVVTVTVNNVKERELPEVDDEFAQLASEFDTIDELRTSLRERVEQSQRSEQAGAIRDKVLEDLLEKVEFELPEAIVQAEVDNQIHEVVHSLDHDEEQLDRLLEAQGSSREKFEADARESATKAVKAQLLLDAVADAEDVQVSQEELTERLLFEARRGNIAPDQLAQQIQDAGRLGVLYAEVRRSKSLADIVQKVTAKDTDGTVIDVADLLGLKDDDAADEDAAAEATDAGDDAETADAKD